MSRLRPRLRAHAKVHRHRYRGEVWYVLQDVLNDQSLRFTPEAYFLIGQMDGTRSLEEIWRSAGEKFGEDAPTEEDMLQVAGQLEALDLLESEIHQKNPRLIGDKVRSKKKITLLKKLMNPLSIQFSILDPDEYITFILRYIRPYLGYGTAVLYFAVVLPGLFLAMVHWSDLTKNILDRALAIENLLILWMIFPILKIFHELGHAISTKHFGGEVHDTGVMFLIFTPIPYVDASSSAAFPEKWKRFTVSAAGVGIELFIASLALFLWLNIEPGAVKTLMFNVMVISGFSTVLFNANPLMRFDGYYILSDWLEIPNLRSRASAYLSYLFQHHALGAKDLPEPAGTPGERAWFVPFGVASYIYRYVIVSGIVFLLMDRVFVVGLFFALMSAMSVIFVPLYKAVKFLAVDPRISSVRQRAALVSGSILAVVLIFLFVIPVPLRTQAEGVVWLPEESVVRAGVEGFVETIHRRSGDKVDKTEPLISIRNQELVIQKEIFASRVRELQVQYNRQLVEDRTYAAVVREELLVAKKQLEEADRKLGALRIRSHLKGRLILPNERNLPGRFVRKGEVLGYIVVSNALEIRTALPQAEIALVREFVKNVHVRFSEFMGKVYRVRVKRIYPKATNELPGRALGVDGGGVFAIDPRSPGEGRSLRKLFRIDLEVPPELKLLRLGGRVYVRFDHGLEPLAFRLYRNIRQLFLGRFNV